jgi:probable phosphoglycerate mutase
MRFYFVRHGESDANVLALISNRDVPHGLTTRGRQQARALADRLSAPSGRLSAVYCSPLLRATQTATILAAALGLPYATAPALREYDLGVLEGCSDAESWSRYDRLQEDWLAGRHRDRAVEQGESFDDMRRRFVPFVDGLRRTHTAGEAAIVCVGHGGLYRCMLPLILANISHEQVAHLPLEPTACILAEERGQELVCLAWGAIPCLT